MAFIDRVRINVRGGNGGAGVAAFLREKGKPKGKPTGGSGGRGGDVIVEADDQVASLLNFDRHPHWTAEAGAHGAGDLRHGKHGEDAVLRVPLGTMVRDHEDVLVADLVEQGQRVTVAVGGKGGKGNAAFVSPHHKAPALAEQGEYGEDVWITLELKLIADAALIGYPNAGKSTFIAKVSAAKPKIADYPFTTLVPNLGVVAVSEREFVIADIPGLIEGAAEGKGLGHEFLRHVERSRVLVVLLDPSDLQTDEVSRQFEVLERELVAHSPELAARPRIVVLGKSDLVEDLAVHEEWATSQGFDLFSMSSITGDGIESMLHAIADAVDLDVRTAPEREGFVLHRPLGSAFAIVRDGDTWEVTGQAAIRAVNLADLTVPEAADLAARRLGRIGVDDALRTAGAEPGDDVKIGDIVFTYDPDAAVEDEWEDQ
jgi:GTP-binding protein